MLNIYMILLEYLLFSVINLKLYYISYFSTLDRNPKALVEVPYSNLN